MRSRSRRTPWSINGNIKGHAYSLTLEPVIENGGSGPQVGSMVRLTVDGADHGLFRSRAADEWSIVA
mgnify:CR=1 FL=1